MATFNPYGLSYVRTLTASSAVYADGITPFNLGTGFNCFKGDIMAIDVSKTNTVAIPQYIINAAGTPASYLPTIGVANSFIYNAINQNGNQRLPSVNYQLNTPIQAGTSVQVNVITDPFAIYRVQCDSSLGLAQGTSMFKYFRIYTTAVNGIGGTTYTSTNADYSGLGAVFMVPNNPTSTTVSCMTLLSTPIGNTYTNQAAAIATPANQFLVRVIGLADGETWYDASNPSTASSYNSVLVQVVNSALVKAGTPF